MLIWPLIALIAAQQFAPTGPPDSLKVVKAAGVTCRVIRVNLADPRVRVTVEVAKGFPRQAESFSSMISRGHPTIAINGAYFSKGNLKPIGDIVIDGEMVNRGDMGTALAITRDNQAVIRRVKQWHAEDWTGYETVLACGPALVVAGQPDAMPTVEGFKDPHVMAATPRMGVGLTASRELLLVNTLSAVSFNKWAEVMKALGCVDAMNLDAGASLAMYYRGKTLITPGRQLTNLLIVYVDSKPREGSDGGSTSVTTQAPPATRKPDKKAPPIGWPPAKERP